ncbi:putative alpha-glucosidase [Iris pallida]|uniref:Alpha-glucosidase n=1 Tax=Iris pallida TaxID=29817 RepID=A0AAX6I805_IRIPA|nr:putative alpha-glucosidase [Iris pallida]KAJ6849406.1 putative alpha-glucosidase [Iris pallida]
MSAPTMGIPNRPELSIDGIEYSRSSQVAALSPVQCAVYFPEPTNVERLRTKGRFPVSLISASWVALASRKP